MHIKWLTPPSSPPLLGGRLSLLPASQRLPSQPQSIIAHLPVPNYTAWWQRHTLNNLPSYTQPSSDLQSNLRPSQVRCHTSCSTSPPMLRRAAINFAAITHHAFPITILQNIMCKCAKSFSFWGTWSPRLPTGALPLDPTGRLPSPEPLDRPMFILGLSGGISPSKNSEIPPKFDETEEPDGWIHGWMTLTKILVPICLYCLNCTKFAQLILRKSIKIVATSCQILRLNAPNSISAGTYSAPQTPSWI